jgi:RHS repeat-associated protein
MQGKESEKTFGLNRINLGARTVNPTTGRFDGVDMMAEKYADLSPFNYVGNNPIKLIDPDGREIFAINGGVKFTDIDAQILFKTIQQRVQNHQRPLPIHFVFQKLTPNIYKHTLNAFKSGKPEVLTLDNNPQRTAQRRYQATKNIPTSPNMQRDEYPYASTLQGGTGAMVQLVPSKENSLQGIHLKALYSTMKLGEDFLVLPVPNDSEEEPEHQVAPKNTILPIVPPTQRRVNPEVLPLFERLMRIPIFWIPIYIPPQFQEEERQLN